MLFTCSQIGAWQVVSIMPFWMGSPWMMGKLSLSLCVFVQINT